MQLRRIVLTLAVAAAVGLTGACGDDADKGAAPATGSSSTAASTGAGAGTDGSAGAPASGGASGGASGAAPGAGSGTTVAVCKAFVAAYDAEKAAFADILMKLTVASASDDKAGLADAKKQAEALVARVKKATDPELAKLTDPKAKAALEQFAAVFADMLKPESVNDPNFESKLDKAGTEAGAYCPQLNE